MNKYQIGNLVSLKNHPYTLISDTKIGANALMTPPIMVVTEVLNQKKYNPDSEEKENLPSQILCTFYNSKNSSYEKHWFKSDEIIEIKKMDEELKENPKKEISADTPLSLKTSFKNNLVVLLSADAELGKKKISWSKDKDDEKFRIESYLDFLPPVMTVLDIIENDKFLKDRRNSEDGELKKDSSKYLLKCKWFNPTKQTFSEELIPYKIVQVISVDSDKIEIIKSGIQEKNLFKIPKKIQMESSKKDSFTYSLVEIKDIILLNHRVKILYRDLLSNKIESDYLEKLDITKSDLKFDNLIKEKYPDYSSRSYNNITNLQWDENAFYQINYSDKKGRFTTRIITNCERTTFETEDGGEEVFIIANCLLRNGHIRHFKLKNIGERLTLEKKFEELIRK